MNIGKRLGFQSVISLLILICFFCDWIIVDFVGIKLSAAMLPFSLSEFDFLKQTVKLEDLSFLKISYLLYFIPLFCILHLVGDFLGRRAWYWRLDYIIALIAVIVTRLIINSIAPDDPSYLGNGYRITVLLVIIGLLMQLIAFIIRKKRIG